MKMIGLIRVGRDAELKYTPSGTAVLEFPGVYDVGYGDNKTSQWVDFAMFGQRAEKMQSYIKKGQQLVVTADDVNVHTYKRKDGEPGSALRAKVIDLQFCSSNDRQERQPHHDSSSGQSRQKPASNQQPSGFSGSDFDDDSIPFSRKATSPELFLL